MSETKYGKYLKKNAIHECEFAPGIRMKGIESWDGLNCSINWKCITQPHHLEDRPHAHDYDQVLCFIGGNPLDINDFGAEVILSLGEEQEQHLINSPTVVFIPKGLIHCPLYFEKVEKPVVFFNIALTDNTRRSIGSPPPPMIKRY